MTGGLSIQGLRVERGGREVLRGLDLDVVPGEVCALMGASGAGKSTALRAVAALEPFTAGRIRIDDFTLRPGPLPRQSALRGMRGAVGMVFQAHSLFEHLTALDNVTLGPVHALGWPRERAAAAALELLDRLGVRARAGAYPRQLSGGEAQRVAIARALALNPTLLLMDEPTSALDPARRTALAETVRGLAREGRALLLATHDVDFARGAADRVVVLGEGVLLEAGAADQVLGEPRHPATRQQLVAPPQASDVP